MNSFECCLCGFQSENSEQLEEHVDVLHWDIFKPDTTTFKELPSGVTAITEHSGDIDTSDGLQTQAQSLLVKGQPSSLDNFSSASTQESGLGFVDLQCGSPGSSSGFQGLERGVQDSAGSQHLESTMEIQGPENPDDHKHVATIKASTYWKSQK